MTGRREILLGNLDIARFIRLGAYGVMAVILLSFSIRLFSAAPRIFFWPDSEGYFLSAANHVTGAAFEGTLGRTIGYPALLYVVLRFGELSDIYFVQCALAVVTCLAFVASLCVIVRQTRYKTLGVPLAALFTLLLVSYQPLTNYVSFVMPESLYICLSVVVTFLTLAIWSANTIETRLAIFVLGVVLSVGNCLVKPHWWGAAIVSIVLLGAAWAMTVSRDRARGFTALFIAIAGSGVLVFEQWNFSKDDPTAHTFGPLTLFCDHLDIIRPILEKDIPAGAGQAPREALLAEIDVLLATKDPGWALNGGLNGGIKCLYSQKIMAPLSQMFGRQKLGRFAMSAFIDGVKYNPRAYVAKVARQFVGVLSAPFGNPVELASTDDDAPDLIGTLPATVRDLARSVIPVGQTSPVFQGSLASIGYQATRFLFISNHVAIYVLIAAWIASGLLLMSHEAADRSSAWICLACLVLYLSSLSVVAASHTFDFPRYVHTTVPTALLAYFSSILVLLTAVGRAYRLIAPAKNAFAPVAADER
jgi:hypothetical protein